MKVQSQGSSSKIPMDAKIRIGIVGPCSSGKTTLINGLNQMGVSARHIAQEHSFVPDMWQRISQPDLLVFLDVSFAVSQSRRPLNWGIDDFEEQQKRLAHARQHADLLINTDQHSIDEVLQKIMTFLEAQGVLS
jgi:hypothetical protein